MPAPAPAPSTVAENLDERIERIRRRNEELERKHREAEADRLAALKNNACVVVTKRPTAKAEPNDEDVDDEWPRAHRYDTYEFAYETAAKTDEGHHQSSNVAAPDIYNKAAGDVPALGSETPAKGPGGRDYKKFADGEGPPPDPSFNFLADAERDGNKRRAAEKTIVAGKDRRNQQQISSNDDVAAATIENAAQRTRGGLNGSFKSGTGAQRGHNNNAGINRNNRAAQRSGANSSIGDDTTKTSQWKDERERIDEARIGRQKTGDGKWRREWDNEKTGGEQAGLVAQVDNLQIGGVSVARQSVVVGNNNFVEKRDNVTVSVSKDGEVKSVKLQPNRSIGTGRVGNRHPPTANIVHHNDAFPVNNTFATIPPQPHPYYRQNSALNQQKTQPLPPYIHTAPAVVFFDQPPPQQSLLPLTANLPPAARQFLDSRPTLQDRLARHRKPVETVSADQH